MNHSSEAKILQQKLEENPTRNEVSAN